MKPHAESLLSTEEAIEQLLNDLDELRSAIGEHHDARASLEKTREQIQVLQNRLSDIASAMNDAAQSLRTVGTPQILEEISKQTALVQNVKESTNKLGSDGATITKALKQVAFDSTSALANIETLLGNLAESITEKDALNQRRQSKATLKLLTMIAFATFLLIGVTLLSQLPSIQALLGIK